MSKETALIVGSGGREFELGRQAALAGADVFFAPGNGGTEQIPGSVNLDFWVKDLDRIVSFAEENEAFTIIGPEAPLMAGLSDRLRERQLPVFGPSQEAAHKSEGSKIEALGFMERNGLPHPTARAFFSYDEAVDYIANKPPNKYVIKADGLAGGKGVVLSETHEESLVTLEQMFSGEGFDGAGKEGVVIQERYHGNEVSAFVMSDGKNILLLPLSQDYKRLQVGDEGPNTGGMGAYSPVPREVVSSDQFEKIYEIAEKSIAAFAREGTPYQGVLYMGLMLAEETGGDPVLIEYNARFGDPETEVVLPHLKDAYGLMRSAAEGQLSSFDGFLSTLGRQAITFCLAVPGYPENPHKGSVIHGLEREYPDTIIHHAGTVKGDKDRIFSAGGRVLYITGLDGGDIDIAARRAFDAIGPKGIHFADMQYRPDIAWQARKGKD